MKVNYKQEQEESRLAWRKARYGKKLVCRNCFIPLGKKGSSPMQKVEQKGKETYYIHSFC